MSTNDHDLYALQNEINSLQNKLQNVEDECYGLEYTIGTLEREVSHLTETISEREETIKDQNDHLLQVTEAHDRERSVASNFMSPVLDSLIDYMTSGFHRVLKESLDVRIGIYQEWADSVVPNDMYSYLFDTMFQKDELSLEFQQDIMGLHGIALHDLFDVILTQDSEFKKVLDEKLQGDHEDPSSIFGKMDIFLVFHYIESSRKLSKVKDVCLIEGTFAYSTFSTLPKLLSHHHYPNFRAVFSDLYINKLGGQMKGRLTPADALLFNVLLVVDTDASIVLDLAKKTTFISDFVSSVCDEAWETLKDPTYQYILERIYRDGDNPAIFSGTPVNEIVNKLKLKKVL